MKIIEQFQGVTFRSLAGLAIVTIIVVAAAPKLIHIGVAVLGIVADALGGK
jgi:hypothetical protein